MKTKYTTSSIILFAIAFFCPSPGTYAGISQGSETNTKNGNNALQNNTTGTDNSAYGVEALFSNTTGSLNTATGWSALGNNTIGTGNIALGAGAGHNLDGDNNIDIGNDGVSGDANTIRIGNPVTSVYNDVPNPTGRTTRTTHPANTDTYIAGIFGSTTSMGMPVYVDS